MFLKQSLISDATLNNEGLKIVYDDVAPYAKENSNPQVIDPGLRPRVGLRPRKGLHPKATTVRQEFPDLKRDDLVYPGYALCMPGFALLNGDYVNFPDNPDDYGFISDEISNDSGDFKYTFMEDGLQPKKGLHPQMFLFPKATTKSTSIGPQPPNTKKIIRYSANPNGSSMTEYKQSNSQYVGVGYMPNEIIEHENLFVDSNKANKDPKIPGVNTNYVGIDKSWIGDKIKVTANRTSDPYYRPVAAYHVLPTGPLVLSFRYTTSNRSSSTRIKVGPGNNSVRTPLPANTTDGLFSYLLDSPSGNYSESYISIDPGAVTSTVSEIGAYIIIWDMKLERGTVATPWTPAPSDWLSDPNNYQWIPIAEYGKYVGAPTLTINFNQKFTSVGLLLTFNTMSGDYADHINVQWLSDNILISSMDFEPNDTKYFCSNYVMHYDKIVITFLHTSKPNRPVFLTRIDYGIYREFLSDEVRQVSCLQEINAISENISINTMNFTVMAKSSVPFDLQKKQKLSLYFNGGLIGNFYLKNGAKKSKTDYFMDAHDALGLLDGNEYHGGIYTGQLVPAVIAEIFDNEDFNYLLSDVFDNVALHGYIPYTSKRNALVQIAFAIGAVVDTSNYDGVVIYPKQQTKTGEFTGAEVFDGLTLEHSDVVTGVRLTVHDYQQSNETAEIYKGVLNGTAEVIFTEAYHDLSITGGTINSHGDNFAFITGTGAEVTLTGKKYSHFTSTVIKENPNIIYNKNIKEVQDATLVYKGNASTVLDRVYEYYQHAENVVCDVLLGDKVIGQVVDIDTDYDGVKRGTIENVSYSFAGSIKAEVTIHE